jgi:hypothetical protein
MAEPARDAAPRAPASERVLMAVSSVFAVWTLACHAAVWAGGSLHQAMAGAALGWAALGAAWWWRRGRGAAPDEPQAAPDAPGGAGARWPLRVALLAPGLAGAVLLRGQLLPFWWCAVGVLGAAWLLFVAREPPRFEAAARGRALEAGLWALAGACVLVTLVAHRFDLDDAFYVNLAVAAADAPDAPLLVGDTMHGVPGLPIHLPVYRLHSYELWNGALSALTGIPAIAAFHLVSASLAAALAALALACLARRLTPKHWLWTVAATLWVMVAVGGVHRWYGNFAFVRMWQGKGIFLFVFLPLVASLAIDLARRPRAETWLRLAAAEVAALGCTSSALWAAPAAALATAACALPLSLRGLGRLALVLLASAYVLGAGWNAKQAFEADRSVSWTAALTPEVERVRRERAELTRHAPGSELEIAVELIAGESRLRVAVLAALVGAWALCPAGLALRYAVVVPLAVTVVLLDPYTTRWVTSNLTGASFWRAFWVLPVPLLLGFALTAPLQLRGRRAGRLGAAGACLLFALGVPSTSGLAEANAVRLSWPGLKVNEESYRWAELLTQLAGPGAVVVAPGDVCPWLPTFHHRVAPLIVRPPYLRRYVSILGAEDLQLRLLMTNYVSGSAQNEDAQQLFEAGLERFGVRAVLLRDSPVAPRARASLRRAGFEPRLKTLDHEIWLRD